MKILITGGSGLIGQYLNVELSRKHEILTQYNSNYGNCLQFSSVKVDITDYVRMEKLFKQFKPEIVIHTAAVSSPENADSLPADLVYEINVNATERIAQLCNHYNAKLIYLSTDLVYAGYRGSYLNEDSKLIPVSLYAETKLMGEVKVRDIFDDFLILREALVYGIGLSHSSNNFHKMYESLRKGEQVRLYIDQFRSPLAVGDSARMISELVEKNIKKEIINFAGPERVSRYELGEILCEECEFNKDLLIGSTMEEASLLYKVADVSMNIDKLRSFGVYPAEIRESIRKMFRYD